ncbi:hypothetical protein [Flavobacterium davisii]|uniref:hypothetical protein n=1 Tax=Flavobacterium davisii TaxID=2906077 RepID=UPI0035CE8D4B
MNTKRVSSKVNPLAFFQYLFSNENLLEFENEFYEICEKISNIECNRKEGYRIIQHYSSESVNDEIIIKDFFEEKQYYSEYLKDITERESRKSYNLIVERINELVHSNSEYDKYVNFHINELTDLQTKINKLTSNKIFFTSTINALEIKIKKDIRDKAHVQEVKSVTAFSLKKSYFGADNLKKSQIRELYQISIKYDIIDEIDFAEDDFINFFSSENPYLDKLTFIFNCNNIFAINYLDKLKLLFKNFSYSTISKSESFFSQNGKTLLKQTNLDNMPKISKRQSDIDRLEKLKSELDNLIKQANK